MTKQLLNKFIRQGIGLIIWLMATTISMAGVYPVSDTCQHPAPPVITGTAKSICRNESVVLTATGCAGTVVWSNGDLGNTITVQPQQTTKYTAICRAKPGCISCFAEVWQINVNTPNAPTVASSLKLTCPEETVVVTASNCNGAIRWLNQDGSNSSTGSTWSGKLPETTIFRAVCEQNGCTSNPSIPIAVQIASPTVPIVSVDKSAICAGQSIHLKASNCIGTVRWTDGEQGLLRTVNPYVTTTYRAVCQLGTCRSDSSESISVAVRSVGQLTALRTTLTNACPFQTADLSNAITNQNNVSLRYEFRTGPSLLSSAVQSPAAVLAGTYYIFGRNVDGCYTEPAAVLVTIQPCSNAIAPCLSNPATVAIRIDSLDWTKGVVNLTAQLGGSATAPVWQSDGGGLFTSVGSQARYLLSETDRQTGRTTFTVSTADADGSGPCLGASTQQTIMAPSREIVGLSKRVSDPIWITDKNNQQLVELTYQFTTANLGKRALTDVKLTDDLDATFSAIGAKIQAVNARSESGLVVNALYSGRGSDTTLVTKGTLAAGEQATVWLTVQVDVSQASTLTFSNKATIETVDADGKVCRDGSTNGIEVDPDQNGDPADNNEPTNVTLHSLRPEESETVFIPEGFSPNGDGINDRFALQRVPFGVTVQMEIYNRWGQLVYQNTDYKNDWDGTASQSSKTANAKADLPDGTYYYQIHLSDGRDFVRFLTLAR